MSHPVLCTDGSQGMLSLRAHLTADAVQLRSGRQQQQQLQRLARAAAKLEAVLKTPLWAHTLGCSMLSLGFITLAVVLGNMLHTWADDAEAEEVHCPSLHLPN